MQRKYWAYHLCQGLGLTGSLLYKASLVAQLVKNLPAMWETWVQPLGWEDPLEKGTPTHSSIWPGEFHGLYSPWSRRVRHDWATFIFFTVQSSPDNLVSEGQNHLHLCAVMWGCVYQKEEARLSTSHKGTLWINISCTHHNRVNKDNICFLSTVLTN